MTGWGDGIMEINLKLIKNLRKEAKISQEKVAEILCVDVKTVSRFENGQGKLDMWEFKSYMEALGISTEDFWMLFLSTVEYDEYRIYKRLKRLKRDRQYDEIRRILYEDKKLMDTNHKIFRRFIKYLEIDINKELPLDESIKKLRELIKDSRTDFDEAKIAECKLTADEISILTSLASHIFSAGEQGKAIGMVEAMIKSRGISQTTEEDREKVFPVLYSNLSSMLGQAGRYKEALKSSDEGLQLCKEYSNFRWVPNLLYNKACSLRKLGEEEAVYKICLIRAYHCAFACGNTYMGNIIKDDAKEAFGIDLSCYPSSSSIGALNSNPSSSM